jgi:hypothetical protein
MCVSRVCVCVCMCACVIKLLIQVDRVMRYKVHVPTNLTTLSPFNWTSVVCKNRPIPIASDQRLRRLPGTFTTKRLRRVSDADAHGNEQYIQRPTKTSATCTCTMSFNTCNSYN